MGLLPVQRLLFIWELLALAWQALEVKKG